MPPFDTLTQAWKTRDGGAWERTSEALLEAGLYTDHCLTSVAAALPAEEESELWMDALNLAAQKHTPLGPDCPIQHAGIFALPLIGKAAPLRAWGHDSALRASWARGLNTTGFLNGHTRAYVLDGVWSPDQLLHIHPQMLRDTLLHTCAQVRDGHDPTLAPVPALAGLCAQWTDRPGDMGVVSLVVVIDTLPNHTPDLHDLLTHTLAGGADTDRLWDQAWQCYGPYAALSPLLPVGVENAAAACLEINALTSLMAQGGRPELPITSQLRPTPNGGATLTLAQPGGVAVRATITALVLARIGASLHNRFCVDEAADDDLPVAQTPQAHLHAFLANLCPPRGALH